MEHDLYQLFLVSPDAPFAVIKRAYYARAKECHPDRFGNSPAKTAEFQRLAAAFNILSDPVLRRRYDRERNHAPPETSLATLLGDLAKTEVFITFREGKNCYYRRQFRHAATFFRRALTHSPQNILYHVFAARNAAQLGDPRTALNHYRQAIKLGSRRKPPLQMPAVRREYETLLKQHFPLRYRLREWLKPAAPTGGPDDAEQELAALNRALTREYRRQISAPERKNLK